MRPTYGITSCGKFNKQLFFIPKTKDDGNNFKIEMSERLKIIDYKYFQSR